MFPVILRREIIIALAAKAVLLAVLYVLFFSPSHRAPATDVGRHILDTR